MWQPLASLMNRCSQAIGLRISRKFLFGVISVAAFAASLLLANPATAAGGTNQQINFQGRLLNGQGAVVPDGFYNIEFKIYQDGDGQTAGDTTGSPAGTLKWTEDYLNVNSQGVEVKNGFLSVQLGSVTPFGTSVDWNQDTLWLSMNVAGTGTACASFTACTPDGEMLPMKRLSSTPYAMNAGQLGGLTAAAFGQLAATQTWSGANTYTGNLQIQGAGASNLLSIDGTSGNITVGSATTNATANLFILDSYNGATDPVGSSDGSMYYNTSTNTFRCHTNGAWVNCDSGGAATGSFVNFAPSSAQVDSSSSSSIFINKTGSGNLLQLQAAGADAFVVNGTGDITLGNAANHTVSLVTAAAGAAGKSLTISAGGAGSGAGALTGGSLVLQGGMGGGVNGNGGDVLISGGTGTGTGTNGLVIISTPTFAATNNDPNCYTGGTLVSASCTIATATIDSSATIVVGFTKSALTATLPDPTNKTVGRVVYITAANGSSDFTLSVNGGGTGNEVAMRQNSSATMVWNGNDWAAAGASSSTTLQAAYDNTLQSAGGAELVVSHTGNTNGLTIRDSSVNPVNGTLMSVQTSSAATLLSINSAVTEYSSDGGAETSGSTTSTFPANTWGSVGSAFVSRYTNVGNYVATGKGSVSVTTSTLANDGVKNVLDTTLTANMHYNVSFAARLGSGTFTDLNVYYSVDGTTASVPCTTSHAVTSSIWSKINCAFAAPATGITTNNALLMRQTAGGTARTFYIDNLSITIAADYNYATDPGADDGVNFATNWSSVNGATVTRSTTIGNDASTSAQVVTTGSGQGVRNKLTINPLTGTLYRVTVYAASTTAGFDNFTVRYSRNAGGNFDNCADYNTQTVSDTDSIFTEITCYITTSSTPASSPYVYFTQTDSTGRTFYVDTFSMTLTTNTTPNVQIGSGMNGGPVTLFTLDRAASAPIATNNDAFLGSMYYDTSLGKLQCYEQDGWGACGSSPDNIVTISPEYTNAVMHGTGVGTMSSDICSGSPQLQINDGSSGQPTICGANETYNFYKWTSPQPSAQTYSIYVTYQLPGTFKQFASGQTSLMGRTDSSNATVRYSIFRSDSSSLTQCGPSVTVSNGSVSTWQVASANGATDPATCGFSASNSIVFKIDVVASQNANAYVGNLNFTFSNR